MPSRQPTGRPGGYSHHLGRALMIRKLYEAAHTEDERQRIRQGAEAQASALAAKSSAFNSILFLQNCGFAPEV